jgi:hypothetical protein
MWYPWVFANAAISDFPLRDGRRAIATDSTAELFQRFQSSSAVSSDCGYVGRYPHQRLLFYRAPFRRNETLLPQACGCQGPSVSVPPITVFRRPFAGLIMMAGPCSVERRYWLAAAQSERVAKVGGGWAGSGLSPEVYCARRGISVASLQPWRKILAQAPAVAGSDSTVVPTAGEAALLVAGGHRPRGGGVVGGGGAVAPGGVGFDHRARSPQHQAQTPKRRHQGPLQR